MLLDDKKGCNVSLISKRNANKEHTENLTYYSGSSVILFTACVYDDIEHRREKLYYTS